MGKTLFFEGAGWSGADSSKATVGNCRIRTAFHTADGKMIYCELTCISKTGTHWDPRYTGKRLGSTGKVEPYYQGFVDTLFYISKEDPDDDDQTYNSLLKRGFRREIRYTKEGILQFVNSIGGQFDEIRVLPDYGGYRVFKDHPKGTGSAKYNFGDEFVVSNELIRCRREVAQYIYDLEKKEGMEYPNFSAWVDGEDPAVFHILRYFPGKNKHWIVELQEGNTLDQSLSTMRETPLGKWGC